jgi:F-type H+-transporting ATPase subunit a
LITDAVIVTWVVMAIIMVATLLLTRRLRPVPKGGQKVAETIVSLIEGLVKDQLGHHYRTYAPYLGTILIFLVLANIVGIFDILPQGPALAAVFHNPALAEFELEMHPPTKNLNVTLCLAVMSLVVAVGAEFRQRGVRGWLRSFYRPTPVSAFVKLLDYIVRPMSLCLRLFGNMLGGTIVMALMYMALPLFAPAAVGIYFDLFDGGMQAYVFVFLTMIYIAEAVETEDEMKQ